MRRLFVTFMLTLSLTSQMLVPAQAEGDAVAGAKIYLKCRSCHVLDHPTNKMGPHLMQLLGRKAGSVEGFQYSSAMTEAGKTGLIWDEKNLKAFLTSPKTMIPGTSMRFWGLWEGQIDDLTAYLREQPQTKSAED